MPTQFNTARQLHSIEGRLADEYGRPVWHPHAEPLDELIATILSQHTSDLNTDRAFASLRRTFPDWHEVAEAPSARVADAIRGGGLANVKAPRIQSVLRHIADEFGTYSLAPLSTLPLDEARAWLLRLPGVGQKTAACVLLFSLGLPTMPVDTHVHRLSRRLGLVARDTGPDATRRQLESLIGPDRAATYAIHLNFIKHGRAICKARGPRCEACVLSNLCRNAPNSHSTTQTDVHSAQRLAQFGQGHRRHAENGGT
jgi:endonuclease-3